MPVTTSIHQTQGNNRGTSKRFSKIEGKKRETHLTSQLAILRILIISPSSTEPMENVISTTEILVRKGLLLKLSVELVHNVLWLVHSIEQRERDVNLFRVGDFEEGGMDDGTGFEELDALHNLLAAPAESIDPFRQHTRNRGKYVGEGGEAVPICLDPSSRRRAMVFKISGSS
jgi:hypothetical protein